MKTKNLLLEECQAFNAEQAHASGAWFTLNTLTAAFDWSKTDDGSEYWKDVYYRLDRISKAGR